MGSSSNPPLHNYALVGSCFDILRVDPVRLIGATEDISKVPGIHQVFDLSQVGDISGADFSGPVVFLYQAEYGGSTDAKCVEVSTEADYKEVVKSADSLTVSDPTGDLYAGTLSATCTDMRNTTQSRSSVLSYVSQRVDQYYLFVNLGDDDLALSDDMASKLRALPPDGDDATYDAFVGSVGTHYVSRALFGGRALQTSSLSTQDYVAISQSGLDVKTEATATFELLKAKVATENQQEVHSKYKNASSLKTESIDFVGGKTTQQYLDMWALGVPDQPMPIQACFEPLSSLFDQALLFSPSDDPDDLAARQKHLTAAINRHLTTHGTDVLADQLRVGATVTLTLLGPGGHRRLAGGGAFAHTVLAGGPPEPDQCWVLVDPQQKAAPGSPIGTGQVVALVNAASQGSLDACAGSDGDYQVGDGLAGTHSGTGGPPSAEWTLTLQTGSARAVVVNGDLVQIDTDWTDRSQEPCCLMGEPDPNDIEQRVYGFGRPGKPGTSWQIATATPKIGPITGATDA